MTHGTANKALQVTPGRRAKFGRHSPAMSRFMSRAGGIGGAPELDRWPAHLTPWLKQVLSC
jgi:hypothetical protein